MGRKKEGKKKEVNKWTKEQELTLYTDYEHESCEISCLEACSILDFHGIPYREIDIRKEGLMGCFGPEIGAKTIPALKTPWGVFEGSHLIEIFACNYKTKNGFRD